MRQADASRLALGQPASRASNEPSTLDAEFSIRERSPPSLRAYHRGI